MFQTQNWCALPFFHLSTDPTGNIRPCCRAEPIAKIQTSSFKNTWNGESIRALRKDFLAGEKSEVCRSCWNYEDQGIVSFRQRINLNFSKAFSEGLLEKVDVESGKIDAPIQYLELKLTNKCNLACRMCNPENSSRWAQIKKREPDQLLVRNHFNSPLVVKEIEEILNHPMFKIVCFVGGEPFLDETHFSYLSLIKDKSKVTYVTNTNLTKLSFGGRDILDTLDDFQDVRLIVSIDGDAERQKYIRKGISIENFEKNLLLLRSRCSADKWNLFSSAVISLLNIYYIPELIMYSLRFDLIPVPFTIIDDPIHLRLNLLPKEQKDLIKSSILDWYQRFNLKEYVSDNNLKKVNNHFTQVQFSLEQSIKSVVNALDNCDFQKANWKIFEQEMKWFGPSEMSDMQINQPELFKMMERFL